MLLSYAPYKNLESADHFMCNTIFNSKPFFKKKKHYFSKNVCHGIISVQAEATQNRRVYKNINLNPLMI